MFTVEFKFNLGQTIYFVNYGSYLAQDAVVEQGTIKGFQVRKHKDGYTIGVDTGKYNNIPLDDVSDDRAIIEEKVRDYNAILPEDRIIG